MNTTDRSTNNKHKKHQNEKISSSTTTMTTPNILPQERHPSLGSISPTIPPSSKPHPIQKPLSTSFPLVSNEKTNHLFPLLPNPGSQFGVAPPAQQSLTTTTTVNEKQEQGDSVQSKVSLSSTGSLDQSMSLSPHAVTSTEETSVSAPSKTNEEDEDPSRPKTLRYNWTDYEDRLLLKIILSNHAMIHNLRYKPLKRFWELVADLIKKYSINTKISRTHRQCRERFYVLYNKLVKFAEQLGIDPTALHRRLSQGLSFTELEELYLKILQVLRLEDGFKLVVNKEFCDDPKAIEELNKSVSLVHDLKDDESTVSIPSSKSGDRAESVDVVINNTSSQHNKISPFTSLKRSGSKISKFSFSTDSFSPSSDANNTDRSNLNHEQDRANLDDIMSSPPITRLDSRSYSSLSSGVSSTKVEDMNPNVFLKDKKKRSDSNQSSTMSHHFTTNVDDSSNSSVGSSSNNSQGESNGEMDSNSTSDRNTPVGSRVMNDFMAQDLEQDKNKTATDKNTAALEILANRMDKIDTNIEDLNKTIGKMDDKMKSGLSDAFDRIAKFQDGINENIALIISELRKNSQDSKIAKVDHQEKIPDNNEK